MAEVIVLFLGCYYVYRGCQHLRGSAMLTRIVAIAVRVLTDPLMILSPINEICK